VGAIYHFPSENMGLLARPGRTWVLYMHSFLKKSETPPTSPTRRVPRGPKGIVERQGNNRIRIIDEFSELVAGYQADNLPLGELRQGGALWRQMEFEAIP
jgi:hypothetical protein